MAVAPPAPPVGAGDPLATLRALATARARCDARRSPALAADLDRRLDRAALALRPPAVVARAIAATERPLASPLARAWLGQLPRLPPLVLLVLARARWFLPPTDPARRRRLALARALLAGLDRPDQPIGAALAAFLLAGPRFDPAGAPVVARGLAAHGNGDDLTALHLLVPRLEGMLRDLARRLPGDAERAPAPGPGLEGLLRHAPPRRALGDGLVGHPRAVLLTDGGLRHRLAHGRLPAGACTRRVARDVILCYLRLGRLTIPAGPLATATIGGHDA